MILGQTRTESEEEGNIPNGVASRPGLRCGCDSPLLSSAHSCQGNLELTGLPALSQRLSGRGLPARMTQVRDTGCPSRTRTTEALLAICGGAVGKEERTVTQV